MNSDRNPPWRFGRHYNAKGQYYRMPFMPTGSVSLTPFTLNREGPAGPSILKDKDSPKVGKFTHPSGAPDNHLLTVYSPGPVNHQYTFLPQLDGGIYLLKNGQAVTEPAQLRLIKNDPDYNESWPRAVVPYERIYGMKEPKKLAALKNDGSASKHLPEGTPFGLVGTSSFYKRESYPNGDVLEGTVTAAYPGGKDPWKGLDAFTSHGNGMPLNWHNQGGDAGLYQNEDIHAVRILAMEPTTDRRNGPNSGRKFYSHAHERLRILGEIPLRKFGPKGEPYRSRRQPGHQLSRPHSGRYRVHVSNARQRRHGAEHGSDVASTPARRSSLRLRRLPRPQPTADGLPSNRRRQGRLQDLGSDQRDASAHRKIAGSIPAKMGRGKPRRVCGPSRTMCCPWNITATSGRSSSEAASPATPPRTANRRRVNWISMPMRNCVQYKSEGKFPGTYYRLALDGEAKFGYKPVGYPSWGYPNASRTVRMLQSRRSLLMWKVNGRRLDGFSNDDHPSEPKPGAGYFTHRGERVDTDKTRAKYDLDYLGSEMPPPAAVKAGKVKPLTDEDRRTLARWIDLGCPIDLDYDPDHPEKRGYGWMLDDNRPVLTLDRTAARSK